MTLRYAENDSYTSAWAFASIIGRKAHQNTKLVSQKRREVYFIETSSGYDSRKMYHEGCKKKPVKCMYPPD